MNDWIVRVLMTALSGYLLANAPTRKTENGQWWSTFWGIWFLVAAVHA